MMKMCLNHYHPPPPIFLDYLSKNGRRNYHKHTPDTFVIRKEECGWEEYKTEKELFKKLQDKFQIVGNEHQKVNGYVLQE